MQNMNSNSVSTRQDERQERAFFAHVFVGKKLGEARDADFFAQRLNCVLLGPDTAEFRFLAAALEGSRGDISEREPAVGRVWKNRLPYRRFAWPDIIAIAGWGFDPDLVREATVRYGKSVHYVDLAFLRRLVFAQAAWSDDELERQRWQALETGHPGLRTVDEARTFDDWPTLESAVHHSERQGADATGERFENRNSSSFLDKAGYTVAKARRLTRARRLRILEDLVARRGLEEVASFLAWLIEDSSCRKYMEAANMKRRKDLSYLRQQHWDDAFQWWFPEP